MDDHDLLIQLHANVKHLVEDMDELKKCVDKIHKTPCPDLEEAKEKIVKMDTYWKVMTGILVVIIPLITMILMELVR